ncbi:hypothetical protein [Nitratireductor aquibiodomus]|uniref:hypothetical protein n=1 Tax=Nitratireductor aquibiodomus TaxID=204799 RepID=UPI0026CE975E
MAAARVVCDGGEIAETAISVGSCSAVAQRLSGLESRLEGVERSEMRRTVMEYAFPELSPIDDVRGTTAYRHEAAREIVIRALEQAWQGAEHSEVAA